ncbi:hypothetical protein HPB51_017383 [Rhipicephalus microplus]|uniref:Uncharacterized protein n=1 Tax=Rhipicephalus microplus TaxID=6941 RepID=A0A9J6DVL8_RHIMP|nr:hypothetical protein HPB51_017383 [Rhipicephalus microplus]
MSVPRRASLACDALPTVFPDWLPYLSKRSTTRKRPAERQLLAPAKPKGAPSSVSNNDDDPPNCHMSCDEMPAVQAGMDIRSPKAQSGPEDARCLPFESLCGEIPQSFLPSDSWGRHKLELDGVKSVVFSEMKQAKKLDCSPSEPSGTRIVKTFFNPRIVEIDKNMKANVVLMGQSISVTMLPYSSSLTTTEEVRALLKHVDEVNICSGGPSPLEFPHVEPDSAYIDVCRKWRHKKCCIILSGNSPSCEKCVNLANTLRTRKKKMEEKKRLSKPGHLRLPSLQKNNANVAALRRANYALKRSKNRLLKRFSEPSKEVKQARDKLQRVSEEGI